MFLFGGTPPVVGPSCFVPSYEPKDLIFNSADSRISWTPGVAGDRRTWTASLWVEPVVFETLSHLITVYGGGANDGFRIGFGNAFGGGASNSGIWVQNQVSAVNNLALQTSVAFRSPAKVHLQFVCDILNATQADRFRIYVNGSRISAAALSTATLPSSTSDQLYFNAAQVHTLGRNASAVVGGTYGFDGLIADFVVVDGLALDPDVFAEANMHGEWVPKLTELMTADFGTNGRWLDFEDENDLGNDVSGKGNDGTVANIVAADRVDSGPTNRACIWNGVTVTAAPANGGFTTGVTSADYGNIGTLGVSSGLWYWENTCDNVSADNGVLTGVCSANAPINASNGAGLIDCALYQSNANKWVDGSSAAYGASYTNGDVIGHLLDADAGTITFYKNDVSQGLITLTGLTAPYFPRTHFFASGRTFTANFGQRPFAYTLPTGALALCTANLLEPEIKDPAEGFVAELATGANIEAALDALSDGWDWIELIHRRTTTGVGFRWRFSDDPTNSINSSSTAAKGAATALVSGGDYWGLRMRVGAAYGVYTAEVAHTNGAATTVTHNLGQSRCAIIAKRTIGGTGDWFYWHPDLTAGNLLKLNDTSAQTAGTTITSIGANSFQIGSGAASGTYRVIVLIECDTLKLGYWTGNGAADGPFAPCEILPDFVASKDAAAGLNHVVRSSRFTGYNPAHEYAYLNDAQVFNEAAPTTLPVDLVPGGIKVRSTNAQHNTSSGKNVFIALGRPIGGVCVAPANGR